MQISLRDNKAKKNSCICNVKGYTDIDDRGIIFCTICGLDVQEWFAVRLRYYPLTGSRVSIETMWATAVNGFDWLTWVFVDTRC